MLYCKQFLSRKNIIRLFIYFFVSILLSLYISCNKDNPDIHKLEQLKENYNQTRFTKKESESINKLKEEALKQKNNRYTGDAYYYLSLYLSRNYPSFLTNRDSIFHALAKAKEYYQTDGYSRGEMLAKYKMIELLSWEDNHELALSNTLSLLQEAQKSNDNYITGISYTLLGNIYVISRKPDEAFQALENASLSLQKTGSSQKYPAEYNSITYLRAIAAQQKKEFALSLSYCEIYKSNLKKEQLSKRSEIQNNYKIDCIIVINYLELNQLEKAGIVIKQINSYGKEHPELASDNLNNTNLLLARYYFKQQDYAKANQYINSINFSKLNYSGVVVYYRNYALNLKSDILAAQGDYKSASALKNKSIQYSDSVNKSNIYRQINELKNTLEIEKLTLQTEKNRFKINYTRAGIGLISAFCILLIIISYMVIRNSIKLKRKNELIFSQYNNLDKYNFKLNQLNQLVLNQKNKEPDLFERTESYLRNSKDFLKSDISRESLASELGTNRQYLTQAIQEKTGKTFMEYIYDLRLDYSRRLLSYHIELSIDDIYTSSGFNSKSTFYRLFKKKYGLTPNELRNAANKNKRIWS